VVRRELHRLRSRLRQQAGDQAAAQFGNATLQSYMGEFHANLSSLAGHQFTALSAHQALKDLNVVLLLVAGAAIVIALLALAGAGFSSGSAPDGHRAPLALLGIVCGGVRALPDGRSSLASRRLARALAARGRLAGVARLCGDDRGVAVAGAPRRRQPVRCQARERLVWALRLDTRGLSSSRVIPGPLRAVRYPEVNLPKADRDSRSVVFLFLQRPRRLSVEKGTKLQ